MGNNDTLNIRTKRELLELALTEILKTDKNYFRGLCGFFNELYWDEIISFYERDILNVHLTLNIPFNKHTFRKEYWRQTGNTFYWEEGDTKPRIAWLNKQIKKVKAKEQSGVRSKISGI